jgi:hypothetical protein
MKFPVGTLLALCYFLASCTEIYFPEPQPRGVKVTENGLEELIGEYINTEDNDTLKVTKEGIVWSEDEDEEETLGKELKVKKYKNRYFVNFYNSGKGLWQVFVVDNKDPDHLFVTNLTSIDEDKVDELRRKKFSKLLEEAGNEDEQYFILNPSKKQLIKLLKDPIFNENKIDLKKLKQE